MLEVGDFVIYPNYGPAVVKESRLRGEREYLTIEVLGGELTIQLPADSTELVGLRKVAGAEERTRVDAILAEPVGELPKWSQRYKINLGRLASGDIFQAAEVIRDLSHIESERGLSAGETRMLAKAKQLVDDELNLIPAN